MSVTRPKKISEEIIHQNHWWTYKHDKYETAGGAKHDYFYGELRGSVMCVPIMDDGRLVLVVQNRYLRDKQSVEFPCGSIVINESAQQAADRELLEETGFVAKNMAQISAFDPYNGIFKDTTYVFLAEDLIQQANPQITPNEDVAVIFRRPDELSEMIKRGEIWDGQTLAVWALVRDILNKN